MTAKWTIKRGTPIIRGRIKHIQQETGYSLLEIQEHYNFFARYQKVLTQLIKEEQQEQ